MWKKDTRAWVEERNLVEISGHAYPDFPRGCVQMEARVVRVNFSADHCQASPRSGLCVTAIDHDFDCVEYDLRGGREVCVAYAIYVDSCESIDCRISMDGRKLWKVAVIRPSTSGKIECLMGGEKETRSKKLEEIDNEREMVGEDFFLFFLEEEEIGVDALFRISSRMEIAWEIVVRVETFTSVSREMQAEC